jgi:hypothetical protein
MTLRSGVHMPTLPLFAFFSIYLRHARPNASFNTGNKNAKAVAVKTPAGPKGMFERWQPPCFWKLLYVH